MAAGPGTEEARHGIEAWLRGGLLLEKYPYAPGPEEALPKHSHDEHKICLSLDFPGVYGYRGRAARCRWATSASSTRARSTRPATPRSA
ncbi:MAG TPA: hypothetical protein VKA51_03755 [Rubrobacteraceae bacterium]|nr:hypothetical protein [Rubrobacteraceae bacterium]